MRYTGPKDRLSRREGFDLFNKGAKLTRLNVTPGQHGPKGQTRQPSQYGRQLREKQKVKRMYGLTESKFSLYMEEALRTRGNTGEKLITLLENRLDNVVFRLGFTSTRPQARQLVTHRHVLVNGKRLNIPSYQVKVSDTITLSGKSMEIPNVKKLIANKEALVPSWLKRKGPAGVVGKFNIEDVKEPISTSDIIEFYSR